METRDKILQLIRAKGPVLPVQISKEIETNIIMASAHLAELTANSKLKISALKVGGSPLYYIPGQEAMLHRFTANLNDKDKKAFDLLNQNKILRDSEQEPVIRVALRMIKDFAMPLNVKYGDKTELFWKWHLSTEQEAETLIKSKLGLIESKAEKYPEAGESKILAQKAELLPEDKKEKITSRKKAVRKKTREDVFLTDITRYFEKNKIKIISTETIKKNSELDFVVEIPSVVGNLQYYCTARNKKTISDSDLSHAYVKGQFRKLPVLFVSNGDLSNKAREILSKELNTINFKKM
jgi:hypothetical protein